jgi:hypothetical protein
MGKNSYFYTEFCIYFFSVFYYACFLLCLSIFNNKIYLLFSQLWCRAPVGCCIVDGWVDCWCSDVSLVWRKPNRNAAAFLLNLRNDQFLHRCLQVLHHQSTGVLYHTLRFPEPLHWCPEVLLCPELLHHLGDGRHHMTTYTAYPTTPRLLSITLFSTTYWTDFPKYYSVPSCYTEAPADFSTKTVEYYTEAAKY